MQAEFCNMIKSRKVVLTMNQSVCISANVEQKMIARYVHAVNNEIIATGKQKRKLFGDLKSDIHERIADGKIASYEDIVSHFGTPEQVAKDFFATADIKEIKKKLLIRRIIVAIVVCCVLTCATGYGYWVWFLYNGSHTYVTETFEADGRIVYEDMLVEDNRHDKTKPLPHLKNRNDE